MFTNKRCLRPSSVRYFWHIIRKFNVNIETPIARTIGCVFQVTRTQHPSILTCLYVWHRLSLLEFMLFENGKLNLNNYLHWDIPNEAFEEYALKDKIQKYLFLF